MTISPLFDLFYPRLCVVCGRRLHDDERHLCLHCLQHLPRTGFHTEASHAMEQLFRGKADIVHAIAYFYTSPQSEYRHILHHIKYHDGKECARYLGRLYASELAGSDILHDIDLIIPVPLHRKRLHSRGYNQSEWIARGIAEVIGIPLDTRSLIRYVANPSQTRLSLYERWINTQSIFALSDSHNIQGRNILLIDDIVTTGATLLACVNTLNEAYPGSVSLLTLSIAR
ncbi:MAG: ComF family protein [Coprobacter sp.]|nr:ComF family protein [Coprobacter sp.]